MDENRTAPATAARSSALTARRHRVVGWGAVIGGVAVVGGLAATAGGALAVAPSSSPAQVAAAAPVAPVTAAASSEPAGTGPMPEGYTAEQYDAFWGAGYTAADADALAALWSTDLTSAKARAGQALLDGAIVPVAPGDHPDGPVVDEDPLWTAFSGAGYTYDDAVELAELWNTDVTEAKARIGRAVLDGRELPIAPGSSGGSATSSTLAGTTAG